MDIDDFTDAMTAAAKKAGLICDRGKTHIQMVYLDRPESPDDTPENVPRQIVQGVSLAAIKDLPASKKKKFVSDLMQGVKDHAASMRR